jgi:hypothetical protein
LCGPLIGNLSLPFLALVTLIVAITLEQRGTQLANGSKPFFTPIEIDVFLLDIPIFLFPN